MSTPVPTQPSTTADAPTKTEYLVFRQQIDENGPWSECARMEASSADTAIRKYLADVDNDKAAAGTTYAAVPVRSFTKRTPRVVTETRLVLE